MRLTPRDLQSGFTLVEVMITVFVVAVGLLAAAALQAVSKRAAVDAMQRTTATVIAQDMVERMRANRLAYREYEALIETQPADPGCGLTADCSGAALVAYDKAQWWRNLDGAAETIANGSGGTENAGGLRNPKGCVRTVGDVAEVVVVWRGMSQISQGAVEADNIDDPTGDPCFATHADFEPESGQSYRRVLRIRAHIG